MATKKVNIDIIAKDKSKQALSRVRKNLDGVKKSVFNLRNAFIGLGAGLVIRNLVNTGKEIENLNVRLKFLFGTAEEGSKAFKEMSEFASQVPFSLEEIQKGAGSLAVVSRDAEHLRELMEITGNAAALTGLDFATASSQIQRSLSGGIAAADLFRETGLKALLGFKEGAKITAEDTARVFEEQLGKDGKFGGTTKELAETFGGTMSMLGDKVFNFKKELLDAGFFSTLKTSFSELNKFVQENQEAFDMLARSIGIGLTAVLNAIVKTIKGVTNGFIKLKEAIIAVSDFVGLSTFEVDKQNKVLSKNADNWHRAREEIHKTKFSLEELISTLKEEMKATKRQNEVYYDYALQRRRLANILAKEEEENLRRNAQLHKQYGHTRLLGVELDFKKEQELQKNNFHTMLDEAQLNEFKKAELKKQANALMVSNSKETLQALSGINKTAFEAYKKYQIAETTINAISTASQVFKQYAGIFPLNIAIAAGALAKGMAQVALIKSQSYSGRQQGGMVKAGQPYMVGEAGKEMFIPNQSGKIVPNHDLGKAVNVNFNITTVDASGFNQLLNNSRGTIVNMINSAVNETGRQAIV